MNLRDRFISGFYLARVNLTLLREPVRFNFPTAALDEGGTWPDRTSGRTDQRASARPSPITSHSPGGPPASARRGIFSSDREAA